MSVLSMNFTKGQVLRYMFMPQIMPRLNEFAKVGFSQLAYIIALVYRAVNLLPQNHWVLLRENRRKIGLRDVIFAAAAQLKYTRKNIDKIIIFYAILVGLALLALQFTVTLAYLMLNPALAQTMPTTYAEFFSSPSKDDLAYRMLFTVFGVPEIFKAGGTQSAYHTALQSMFQLYSVGLLVIAVLIVCYFIFAIVVETAQTGVPFGKRYNHVWTPIRLVFALGLLVPIGYGLNAAQWITLYSAKFGSDFATQGWILFNDKMTDSYLEHPESSVGTPKTPELMGLAAFMSVVTACQHVYAKEYGDGAGKKEIMAYLAGPSSLSIGPVVMQEGAAGYDKARQYFGNGDILIRFGEYNKDVHKKYRGSIYPYCGDLVFYAADAKEPGAKYIQQYYYSMVYHIFAQKGYDIREPSERFIDHYLATPSGDPGAALPDAEYKATLSKALTDNATEGIKEAVQEQIKSDSWKIEKANIQKYGWGGAGMWYNKIAQINGSLVTAVNNIPQPKAMPSVMEYMKKEQMAQNRNVPEVFKSNLSDGVEIQFNNALDKHIGDGLAILYEYWSREDARQDTIGNQTKQTNNIIIDTINLIFGTKGLFDMCSNTDVHPLAQLSILGKGLVEASIRNLGLSVGIGAIGQLGLPFIGAAAGAAASMLLMVATLTLSMGFMLFYVLPFMPFLYFFFAVGGWIKGLFEAMVGVPLWALAHLRIDGEGLPGDAAMTGYFLIFEIFLRPILIVFGLLASVIIFASMVKVLNEIFFLVVTNLSGHDPDATKLCGKVSMGKAGGGDSPMNFFRGPIDELFFTIIYAVIVYMIGMSCFKLIDLIPNNILRYMGADARTFNDAAEDVTKGMMLKLSAGTTVIGNQVAGIAQNAGNAVGGLGKAAMGMVSQPPPKS